MPDLGFALFSLGRIPDAERLLASAVAEAEAAGLPLLGLHAALEGAMIRILSVGEHTTPRTIAADAIPRLEVDEDDLGLARAYLVIASAAWIEGHVAEAMAAREKAVGYAARVGDTRTNRRTTCWGMECYGPTPAIAAITQLEAAVDRARSDPLERAQALFTLSGLYAMRDRDTEARTALRTLRATLDDIGALLVAGSSAEIGGVAELIMGIRTPRNAVSPTGSRAWKGLARSDTWRRSMPSGRSRSRVPAISRRHVRPPTAPRPTARPRTPSSS